MSKEQTPKPYLMKTAITALVRNAAGLEEKRIVHHTVALDEVGVSEPWFVLRNYVAPKVLSKVLGPEGVGWTRIYEAKIIKIVNRNEPSDISNIPTRVMTDEQLKMYCEVWDYPIDIDDFTTLADARMFVELYKTDPEGYHAQYTHYMEKRKDKHPEFDKLRNAVSDEFEDLSSEFDSLDKAPIEVKKKPKKAKDARRDSFQEVSPENTDPFEV